MLSIAGGVLGVAARDLDPQRPATWVGSRLPIPLLSQVTIDPSVMAFAAIVTVLTTLICGLAPAIGATGGSLVTALRDGAPSVSGSRRGRFVRQSFVMAEIALALTVLCGAGLLGRSLMELQSVKPGFTAESALSLRVSLPQRSYADSNAQHTFLHARDRRPRARCRKSTSVGGTSFLPLAGVGPGTSFWRADAPQPPPNERPVVDARPVTAGYFTAMDIPLLAGRDVNEGDTPDKDPVAVINETFARQIYPGDNPIGRKFILNLGNEKPHEIIGVVGDVKLVTLEGEIRPTAYLSSRQYAFGLMTFVVRTTGDPARLGPAAVRVDPRDRSAAAGLGGAAARRGVRGIDRAAAADGGRDEHLRRRGAAARRARRLRHRRVFGVAARRASSAFASRSARGRARSSAWSSARTCASSRSGLVAGLLTAIPATRLLRGLLFQVGPNDPMTFVGDRRDARGGRDRRVVSAGAARHAGRSGRDAESGIG